MASVADAVKSAVPQLQGAQKRLSSSATSGGAKKRKRSTAQAVSNKLKAKIIFNMRILCSIAQRFSSCRVRMKS